MKKAAFFCLLMQVFFYSSLTAVPTSSEIKKNMLSTVDFIGTVFESKYAPCEWKQSYYGWNLQREIEIAKTRLIQTKNPSLKEFQGILRDLFNSTKDYHVSIQFFSTESASLPFLVKSAEGRTFVSYIDKKTLPSHIWLSVGDEIVSFNGQPIQAAIKDLALKELGSNTPETDFAEAELLLTNRIGATGITVPKGPVSFQVRRRCGEVNTYTMDWNYQPEKFRDFTRLKNLAGISAEKKGTLFPQQNWKKALHENGFFSKWEVNQGNLELPLDTCGYAIGARHSYIPELGNKFWESDYLCPFHAYIFRHPCGKKVGYIRIPHYAGCEDELADFSMIIKRFEKETDALVIDQINNPGGSLFYLYALLSHLTNKPLVSPKHHLTLTQLEIDLAIELLPIFDLIRDDETAKDCLGETFDGYPVDMRFVRLFKSFCEFILKEWNEGHLYTSAVHVFGVDDIQPDPVNRYTKPILLITNPLCYSCGDFFPAILQDNKRAVVFGTRTSGAGGYVVRSHFPNMLGIKGFSLTGSLAERINKKPIENLGVLPDVSYNHTLNDLQNNYIDYRSAILKQLQTMMEK